MLLLHLPVFPYTVAVVHMFISVRKKKAKKEMTTGWSLHVDGRDNEEHAERREGGR